MSEDTSRSAPTTIEEVELCRKASQDRYQRLTLSMLIEHIRFQWYTILQEALAAQEKSETDVPDFSSCCIATEYSMGEVTLIRWLHKNNLPEAEPFARETELIDYFVDFVLHEEIRKYGLILCGHDLDSEFLRSCRKYTFSKDEDDTHAPTGEDVATA